MSGRDEITMIGPDGQRSAPFSTEDLERLSRGRPDRDPIFYEAAARVIEASRCSTSWIQREMGIGYRRASAIVEQLEDMGIVTTPDNVGRREVQDVGTLKSAIDAATTIRSALAETHLAGLRPVALDIDLHRRFGEGEEGRPEAHVEVLDLEKRLEELGQNPFQIGDIGVAVDDESLQLMEHRRVGGVRILPVGLARPDEA